MKLHTLTVPQTAEGTRLYAAIRRMLPQVADYQLREAFARRDVKQNGVRVTKDALAIGGATAQVYCSEDGKALSPEIVYQDQNLIVIWKPTGVSCVPDAKGGLTVSEWLWQTGAFERPPMPCHRLDHQTDGLLLLAKEEATLHELEEAFRQRRIHKRYECLVKGVPQPTQAVLEAYLRKDAQAARVTVLDHPAQGAKPIRTGYRVLSAGETSRLSVELFTGRTHQIRAQLAHIGHPILGDDVYGDRTYNRAGKARRLMLTAVELRFDLTGALAYLNDLTFRINPRF